MEFSFAYPLCESGRNDICTYSAMAICYVTAVYPSLTLQALLANTQELIPIRIRAQFGFLRDNEGRLVGNIPKGLAVFLDTLTVNYA